jgi:membrane protein required for colicin V production
MNIIDFILIFILAFTAAVGFFFGLIQVLGAIVTIIVSIFIAGVFFSTVAPYIQPYAFDNQNFSSVIAFIVIYWIVSLFLSFVVKIANKIFNLPILKTANRLLGAGVSLLGAIIILSVFFYLFKIYAWSPAVTNFLSQSTMAYYFSWIGKFVTILIPGL